MSQRQLEQHVTLLGWLHIIGHALFLVIGAFVFVLLAGIGAASGDFQAARILVVVATAVGLLMIILALPGLAAGYGLLRRKSWGRILAIIMGALNLPNFPLGTALGLYTLWVLLQPEAADYFAGNKSF